MQQLLMDQLQELRIASEFSDVPMAAWVEQEGCVMPIVACHNWIMPKDCFVQLWFWVMAEGKIYTKLWDHKAWSMILLDLNTHNHVPSYHEHTVLEWIFQKTCVKTKDWDLAFKCLQFERVITELSDTAPG